jgi:hypothetical protein
VRAKVRSALPTRTWLSVALTLAALGVLIVVLVVGTGGGAATQQVITVVRPSGGQPYAHVGPAATKVGATQRTGGRSQSTPSTATSDPGTERLARVPATLAADGPLVRAILERVLGPTTSTGTPRVVSSRCAGGACTITYRADERGSAVIFAAQTLLWRQLFFDPRVQRVTLNVVHASQNPEHARIIIFRETCTRTQAQRIDWKLPPDRGLRRYCTVIDNLGGAGTPPGFLIPGPGNGNGPPGGGGGRGAAGG